MRMESSVASSKLCVDTEGEFLYTASTNGHIERWYLDTGKADVSFNNQMAKLGNFNSDENLRSLAVSNDNESVIFTSNKILKKYNIEEGSIESNEQKKTLQVIVGCSVRM